MVEILLTLLFPLLTGYVAGFFKVYWNIPREKSVATFLFAVLVAYLGWQFIPITVDGYIFLIAAVAWSAGWLTGGCGPSLRGPKQIIVPDDDIILEGLMNIFRKNIGDEMGIVWYFYMLWRHLIPFGAIGLFFGSWWFLIGGFLAWVVYYPVGSWIANKLKGRAKTAEGDGSEFISGLLSGLALTISFILALTY